MRFPQVSRRFCAFAALRHRRQPPILLAICRLSQAPLPMKVAGRHPHDAGRVDPYRAPMLISLYALNCFALRYIPELPHRPIRFPARPKRVFRRTAACIEARRDDDHALVANKGHDDNQGARLAQMRMTLTLTDVQIICERLRAEGEESAALDAVLREMACELNRRRTLHLARRRDVARRRRSDHTAPDGELRGRMPLGYHREGLHSDRIVVNPEGAETVRAIFALRERGASLRKIADYLTAKGSPTGQGGAQWYASSVRQVLRHEACYRGGRRGSGLGCWPALLPTPSPKRHDQHAPAT